MTSVTNGGDYTYKVTPRYFDSGGAMQALDSSLSASVTVPVGPFKKGPLTLGFTRGYMQSSAYVHHFGKDTPVVPDTKDLEFDTNTRAGTNNGQPVTFAQIYNWMGETAREQVFAVLKKVLNDHTLTLKVFAYDLAEPDVAKILLTLAEQGRAPHPGQRGFARHPVWQTQDAGRPVYYPVQPAEKGTVRHCARIVRALFARQDFHRLEGWERHRGPHRLHELLSNRTLRERQSRPGL
jgi:hypothetical protein